MKRFDSTRPRGEIALTVVCAVWNGAHCVDGLLSSYRREATADSQLVVLDGGSTDTTWDIILQYQDCIDTAVSERDAGIYDAWNKALPHCRGRHVAFIGADDVLARGSIQALVQACRNDEGHSHIVAGFNVLTRAGVPVALLGRRFDPAQLHRLMMIAHVMSAHRLDWLRSVNGFDASYRSSGDYELMLRERHTLKVKVISEVLAFMEDGGMSRTSLRPLTENFRARRAHGYSLPLSVALLVRAVLGDKLRRLLGR